MRSNINMTEKSTGPKWVDVKELDFNSKLQFWQDKYQTWSCEKGKMKSMVSKSTRNSIY